MTFRSCRRRRHAALAIMLSIAATQAAAQERRPVAGAGDWQLSDRLPGVEQRACTARITGPDANTTLTLNNDGVPVLLIGRADWSHDIPEAEIILSIDGAAPMTLQGTAVINLVLVLISDVSLLRRLREARMLDWRFPFGRFRTNAAGLGAALDAVRACQQAGSAA